MKKWFLVILLSLSSLAVQAHEGSVVFIHGFFMTYRSMVPIKRSLENLSLDLYLWDYRSRNDTVAENAEQLVCFLQKIAACAPDAPIHFVTHSSGAWVLRSALNHPCCPEEAKVGRAVLVAPPNRGSTLARDFKDVLPVSLVLGNDSGWELRNYTECDVIQLGNFPEEMQVLIIAGCKGPLQYWRDKPNDGFLLVEETALNTSYYLQLFNTTHGGLLKDQAVKCLIRSFIYHGFPEESSEENSEDSLSN